MAETERQGPLEVGQKFLKYTIREEIGRGGHAWVYHGHDSFLDNEVAIKILHRHGGVSEDMLRRGQAEAKLLFRLKHPNIVEVQDAGISDDGLLYIVMELLRGKSLRDVLRERSRLPLREALELFVDLTKGVEAAHAFGAIHRDLKPENVFILDDGSSKVLDFGIAKVVDVAGMTTERDVLHGTILYISPEQLEGHRATPRSDLYGLGLVFFETLHGRHPLLLKATNPTVRDLSLMQIAFRPPRLNELDPNIPRHVARIVERLLMKSPAERVQSTQELRAALTESLRRISEEGSSAAAELQPAETRQAATGRDTERIPLEFLPDQTDSNRLERRVATEPLGTGEVAPAMPDLSDSSDITPVRVSSRPPVPFAQSSGLLTAPPLTTPLRKSAGRRPSEDDAPRRRAARALAAGAAVGVGVGAAYLGVQAYSARHVLAIAPPSTSARVLGPKAPAPNPSPEPSAEPAPSPVVASATIEPPASPALAAETSSAAISRPSTVPSRPKIPDPKRHRATNSGKKQHNVSASTLDDDPHRVWIE